MTDALTASVYVNEALRAYELAHAARLREDATARAEGARAGELITAIEQVMKASQTLLERAGLAHVVGAPASPDGIAQPIRRPDEVIAKAFADAQLAHRDIRVALLRLAAHHLNAGSWAEARLIVEPLMASSDEPLYKDAVAIFCRSHLAEATAARQAADWPSCLAHLSSIFGTDHVLDTDYWELLIDVLQHGTGQISDESIVNLFGIAATRVGEADEHTNVLLSNVAEELANRTLRNGRWIITSSCLQIISQIDPKRHQTLASTLGWSPQDWLTGTANVIRTLASSSRIVHVAASEDASILLAASKVDLYVIDGINLLGPKHIIKQPTLGTPVRTPINDDWHSIAISSDKFLSIFTIDNQVMYGTIGACDSSYFDNARAFTAPGISQAWLAKSASVVLLRKNQDLYLLDLLKQLELYLPVPDFDIRSAVISSSMRIAAIGEDGLFLFDKYGMIFSAIPELNNGRSVEISSDAKMAVIAGLDFIAVWTEQSGVRQLPLADYGLLCRPAIHPSQQVIAAGTERGVALFGVSPLQQVAHVRTDFSVTDVAFGLRGNFLVAAGGDGIPIIGPVQS